MKKFILGESIQEMDSLIKQGVRVDCIVTDPPYPLTSRGSKNSSAGGFLKDNVNKRLGFEIPHISEWIGKCYEILKDKTHAYFMTNDKNLMEFMQEITKVGFKISKVLIWKKPNSIPTQFYLTQKEYIIFARKGAAKKIKLTSTPDVIETPNFKKTKGRHNSEKPVELMEILIKNSTGMFDIVLDPFMGSGTTGVAAANLNRFFIGIEVAQEHFETAYKRIKESQTYTKEQAIKKFKDEFKEYIKDFDIEWIEQNLVLYNIEEIISSDEIPEDELEDWEDSNGFIVCGEERYLQSGMYFKKNHEIISADSDYSHIGNTYGNWWFTMDNW